MAEISLECSAGELIAVVTPVDRNSVEKINAQWEITKSADGYYYYPKERKDGINAKKLSSETLQEFFDDIGSGR